MSVNWPWDKSIQIRIVVAYTLVFIVVLGLLTWWIGRIMYSTQLEQGEHGMEVKSFLLANALEDPQSGFIEEFETFRRYIQMQVVEPSDMMGIWQIGGMTFLADEKTAFTQDSDLRAEYNTLIEADCVDVNFVIEGSVFRIVQIYPVYGGTCESDDEDSSDAIELYGLVEAQPETLRIGTWVIDGTPFELTARTEIEREDGGELKAGVCVEVEFSPSSAPPYELTKMETKQGSDCQNKEMSDFSGLVEITPFDANSIILDELLVDNAISGQDIPEMAHLRSFTQSSAQDAEARVTILDRWGNVLTDSEYSATNVPNQLNQIEVQHALSDDEQHHVRLDPLTNLNTVYTAAPIHKEGRSIGVVQLSLPIDEVIASYNRFMQLLIIMSLASILLLVLLGIWLGRMLTGPIRRLETAAIAISNGDLSQQVEIERSDELGALAATFNKMVSDLNRMFTQQNNFVAHASHELRTPLVNIQLRSDSLLRNQTLSDEDRRYLLQVSSETARLGRLSTELLNLAQLDVQHASSFVPNDSEPAIDMGGNGPNRVNEGGITKTDTPTNLFVTSHELRTIFQDLVTLLSPWANELSVTLRLEIPDELPSLKMQHGHLETVIRNLLDNAIKYTAPGGDVVTELRYNPKASQLGESSLELIVSDSGIGIPADDLPYIFDSFFRVDKARGRQQVLHSSNSSGAGLGLSIVKRIIDLYDARIEVQSSVDAGTSFIVELPVQRET